MRIIKKEERFVSRASWLESFHVFNFNRYFLPDRGGFGRVLVINDDVIAAHSGFPFHSHSHMEIVTYIISGQITHEDSMGNRDTIHEGKMQLMSVGEGVEHAEQNEGDTPTRLLQVWILPDEYYQDSSYMTVLPSEDGKRVISRSTQPYIRSSVEIQVHHERKELSVHGDHMQGVLIYIIHGHVEYAGSTYGTGDTFLISPGEKVEFSSTSGYEYLEIITTI